MTGLEWFMVEPNTRKLQFFVDTYKIQHFQNQFLKSISRYLKVGKIDLFTFLLVFIHKSARIVLTYQPSLTSSSPAYSSL